MNYDYVERIEHRLTRMEYILYFLVLVNGSQFFLTPAVFAAVATLLKIAFSV